MPHDLIRADYAALDQIAGKFDQEYARMLQLEERVQFQMTRLRACAWEGESAEFRRLVAAQAPVAKQRTSEWRHTMNVVLQEFMGLHSYEVDVLQVLTSHFGNEIAIECIANPFSDRKVFQIKLMGCEKIVWHINPENIYPDTHESVVIDILMGKPNYQEIFTIVTSLFSMEISYREISLIKSW